MANEDYISYIKELILHHCLRCGDLSETTTCQICKKEIEGESVMVKIEVKISGSAVDAEIAGLQGDFGELTRVALRWKPSTFNIGSLTPMVRKSQFYQSKISHREGGDVDLERS